MFIFLPYCICDCLGPGVVDDSFLCLVERALEDRIMNFTKKVQRRVYGIFRRHNRQITKV